MEHLRQYVSKNYPVESFVDRKTHAALGLRCWELLDPEMIQVIDVLTKFYGKKILVNNWKEGGTYEFSGYRPPDYVCKAIYTVHKRGGAFDIKVPGVAPAQVQIDLVKNSELWPAITRMEELAATPTWTHIDNSNRLTESPGIYIFKP